MSTQPKKKERLACLIAGRNLGDIVLASTFVRSLVVRGYAESYVIWTRPQMSFLFEHLPSCQIFESPFPVGTAKHFNRAGMRLFFAAARSIRRQRVSVSIDLSGDARERWIARLAGSKRHLNIGWAKGHPHNELIRNPFGIGRPAVTVPADETNVYEAYQLLLDELAPARGADSGMLPPYQDRALGGTFKVGLHPFASQPGKLWIDDHWRELASALLAQGMNVVAFGAPSERRALNSLFGGLQGSLDLFTASVREFTIAVGGLDLLIGLDSFAVHVAKHQRVRSIMINAGNPPDLWAVPGGLTLAGSGGCVHYPCFNRAPCLGTAAANVCVRSITVSDVMAAVAALRNDRRSRQSAAAPV